MLGELRLFVLGIIKDRHGLHVVVLVLCRNQTVQFLAFSVTKRC